jgi:type IV pilus assembly protein PilC
MTQLTADMNTKDELKRDFENIANQHKTSAPKTKKVKANSSKIKQSDLILFTTQLSVMLESGVVLSDAVDAIAAQAESDEFKKVINQIASSVKSGEPFSKALSAYPKIFDSMFISMVKASEASGRMPEMLSVLSDYLNFEEETKKQVKGALTYPAVMAVVAVVATLVLMLFVLPKFVKIYQAKGAALPMITRILISVSNVFNDPTGLAALTTTAVAVVVGISWWKSTEQGRRLIDYTKLRIPVVGTMFIDTIVTRSMRIMATMINTGVNLLDTIEVIEGSCDNYYFKQLWHKTDKNIRDGYQLSDAIKAANIDGLISPGIIQMLKSGEKSGKLGYVGDKISIFYEKRLHTSIKAVTSVIEPVMITVLGSIIGTIAIALLLPVFKISNIVAH